MSPAFYEEVRARLLRHGRLAMATLIERRGRAPSAVGAKLAVAANGDAAGTVGGGAVERAVVDHALEVLRTGRPTIARIDLARAAAHRERGRVEVFVEALAADEAPPGGGPTAARLLERLVEARAARETLVVATVVGGEAAPVGTRLVADGSGVVLGPDAPWASGLDAQLARAATRGGSRRLRFIGGASLDLFLEAVTPSPDLVVVGAGQVARRLARVGKALDFEVTIVDHRPTLATRERFPAADRILVGDPAALLARHAIGRGSAVVILAGSREPDAGVVAAALARPADYVGLVGSRRRVAAVTAALRAAGLPDETLRRLRAPLVSDIAAKSPAEIALALAADIVGARRGVAAVLASGRER